MTDKGVDYLSAVTLHCAVLVLHMHTLPFLSLSLPSSLLSLLFIPAGLDPVDIVVWLAVKTWIAGLCYSVQWREGTAGVVGFCLCSSYRDHRRRKV
jgi:hypothetical protein